MPSVPPVVAASAGDVAPGLGEAAEGVAAPEDARAAGAVTRPTAWPEAPERAPASSAAGTRTLSWVADVNGAAIGSVVSGPGVPPGKVGRSWTVTGETTPPALVAVAAALVAVAAALVAVAAALVAAPPALGAVPPSLRDGSCARVSGADVERPGKERGT
jgi:hypothetical protein